MTDEELIARLRGGMPEMRPNRGWGWREDIDFVAVEAERKEAANRIEQLAATNERLEAALREAAHAWATFKGATISDEHFHAVKRLDAALKGADHE